MSGRAVEAAGDVQVLLLDKTGTITLGNRMAANFFPVGGHSEQDLADVAQLASLADETPEGRSVVVLAKEQFGIRERHSAPTTSSFPLRQRLGCRDSIWEPPDSKGRGGLRQALGRRIGRHAPADLDAIVERTSRAGSTPLVVADGTDILGVIELKDVVKQGIREKFAEMRQMGFAP